MFHHYIHRSQENACPLIFAFCVKPLRLAGNVCVQQFLPVCVLILYQVTDLHSFSALLPELFNSKFAQVNNVGFSLLDPVAGC